MPGADFRSCNYHHDHDDDPDIPAVNVTNHHSSGLDLTDKATNEGAGSAGHYVATVGTEASAVSPVFLWQHEQTNQTLTEEPAAATIDKKFGFSQEPHCSIPLIATLLDPQAAVQGYSF